MSMSDAEKAILKTVAHQLVENILPAIIKAEEARLPLAYRGMLDLVLSAVMPKIQASILAKVDGGLK